MHTPVFGERGFNFADLIMKALHRSGGLGPPVKHPGGAAINRAYRIPPQHHAPNQRPLSHHPQIDPDFGPAQPPIVGGPGAVDPSAAYRLLNPEPSDITSMVGGLNDDQHNAILDALRRALTLAHMQAGFSRFAQGGGKGGYLE